MSRPRSILTMMIITMTMTMMMITMMVTMRMNCLSVCHKNCNDDDDAPYIMKIGDVGDFINRSDLMAVFIMFVAVLSIE